MLGGGYFKTRTPGSHPHIPLSLSLSFTHATHNSKHITHTSPATPTTGSTFELLALATSREAADPNFFTEEDPTESAALAPPVSGLAVKALSLEGVLSMQVLVEEGASSSSGRHTVTGAAGRPH